MRARTMECTGQPEDACMRLRGAMLLDRVGVVIMVVVVAVVRIEREGGGRWERGGKEVGLGGVGRKREEGGREGGRGTEGTK